MFGLLLGSMGDGCLEKVAAAATTEADLGLETAIEMRRQIRVWDRLCSYVACGSIWDGHAISHVINNRETATMQMDGSPQFGHNSDTIRGFNNKNEVTVV